jgi:hypothetical protein
VAVLSLVLPNCDGPVAPSGLAWTISPTEVIVRPGSAAQFAITIQTKANINAAVDVTVAGLPGGLTPSFTSMRLAETAATATLTIQAAPGVELGTYSADVTLAEVGGSASTVRLQLSVSTSEGPDITLEVTPIEIYLAPDAPAPTFTYYVRPLDGFTGVVSISLSPVPPELILHSGPTPASLTIAGGAGGTFVLGRRGVADRAFADVTVTASSGTLARTRRIRILLQR